MTLEHNNSLLFGAFVTNANGDICMIWYNYKPSDKKQKDLIVEVLTCSLLACNWNIDTARNFVEKAFSEGSAGLTANGRLYMIEANREYDKYENIKSKWLKNENQKTSTTEKNLNNEKKERGCKKRKEKEKTKAGARMQFFTIFSL